MKLLNQVEVYRVVTLRIITAIKASKLEITDYYQYEFCPNSTPTDEIARSRRILKKMKYNISIYVIVLYVVMPCGDMAGLPTFRNTLLHDQNTKA